MRFCSSLIHPHFCQPSASPPPESPGVRAAADGARGGLAGVRGLGLRVSACAQVPLSPGTVIFPRALHA